MKELTFLLLFMASSLVINAQKITGRVIDRENTMPIEYATVVLQQQDSSFVSSAYTDSLGYFSFDENLPHYKLLVQHLMYKPFNTEFSSNEVGVIPMESNDLKLQEVVVKGERPIVKVVDGKMAYNMELLLENKMATNAYDAILQLPGVYEQSDALKLAGTSQVTVIINGKPTTMSTDQLTTLLKNMPKERIQSAEVMYSAPAQYHVRGAVINLVLKSNLSDSPVLSGQINGEYSQSHYANYKAGATLTYSTSKLSTDFMYQFGYSHSKSGQDIDSHHTVNGILYNIKQEDRSSVLAPIHTIRLGSDYSFDEKNKLSFAYNAQIKAWTRSVSNSTGTLSNSQNMKKSDSPVQMHNLALSYTSGFGLNAGIDYTFYRNHTTQNYTGKSAQIEDAFTANTKQDINRVSFYADQNHDLGKDFGLNYGTKLTYANDKSSQMYQSEITEEVSLKNTDSNLDEYTAQVYAGLSKQFSEKLSLNFSLTGEYYKHKDKDYWSVFPQFEATYTASPSNIFQLSLSSNREYPDYWEMINSVSHISGYAEIHGNPDLKPYRSYEMQLGYIFKGKYIFSLYGDLANDYFVQLPYQSSERLALIYKTTNFDYNRTVGFNISLPFRVGSVLDSRLMVNGFYTKVRSSNFHDLSFENDNFSVIAILNNTFNISSQPNIKAELSGMYTPRNIQGSATLSSMSKIDAGIKWTSKDNKAEVKLKVNDMFNGWSPKDVKTQFSGQNLNMRIIPDSRYISLSFVYKFGGYKESKRKDVDTSRFGSK